MRLRVDLYLPSKLFGFCEGEAGRVFFHASVFHPTGTGEPPPLLGEEVEVELASEGKASVVRRLVPPVRVEATVKTFDSFAGWGFAGGDDGVDYFLHRSDVVLNRLPARGQRVRFWAGRKHGRPRACYVEV